VGIEVSGCPVNPVFLSAAFPDCFSVQRSFWLILRFVCLAFPQLFVEHLVFFFSSLAGSFLTPPLRLTRLLVFFTRSRVDSLRRVFPLRWDDLSCLFSLRPLRGAHACLFFFFICSSAESNFVLFCWNFC